MPRLITLSCSLPAWTGFSSSLRAYSIGCANRSPVSLRSITVMICCFTRPFFPVYSSERSLITNALIVMFSLVVWPGLLSPTLASCRGN